MRKDILEKESDILQMIANNDPKAMICRFLNCRPEVFEKYLKLKGIEYCGNRRMIGRRNSPYKKSVDEYMTQDKISIHKLRIKLIEEGIKKYECENCKLTEWCGGKIPLELHHIDGNKLNNSIQNLEWNTDSENQIHAIKTKLSTYKIDFEIAEKIRNDNGTNRELAIKYKIGKTQIGYIKNNNRWKIK